MDPNQNLENAEDAYIRYLEEALTITDAERHKLKLKLKSNEETGFDYDLLCKLCKGLIVRGKFCEGCEWTFCLACLRKKEQEIGERCPNDDCQRTENYKLEQQKIVRKLLDQTPVICPCQKEMPFKEFAD